MNIFITRIFLVVLFCNYNLHAQKLYYLINAGVTNNFGGNKEMNTYFQNYEDGFAANINKKGSHMRTQIGYELGIQVLADIGFPASIGFHINRNTASSVYELNTGNTRNIIMKTNTARFDFGLESHTSKGFNFTGIGIGMCFYNQKLDVGLTVKTGNPQPADYLTGKYNGNGFYWSLYPKFAYSLGKNQEFYFRPEFLFNFGAIDDFHLKADDPRATNNNNRFPQSPATWTGNAFLYRGEYVSVLYSGIQLAAGISLKF